MKEERSIRRTLALIDKNVSVSTSGSISGHFALPRMFKLIATLRPFESDIAPVERQDLVRRAVTEVARAGRGHLNEQSFDKELRRQVSKLKAVRTSPFKFYGWIACESKFLPQRITWRSRRITFRDGDSRGVISRDDELFLNDLLAKWPSENMTQVEFAIEGRSDVHAAHRAHDVFSELRGCLDLVTSFRQTHWLFEGIPVHPSRVPAYPVVVLNAEGMESKSWYTLNDAVRLGRVLQDEDLPLIRKYVPWVQRRISGHFAQDKLLMAVRGYCAATDTSDYEMSLRRLWTVLELLAGSDVGKVVIKRVASLYHDREFESELLWSFADLRNKLTHSHNATDLDRIMIDQLRVRVHQTFQIHFLKGAEVRSFDELFRSVSLALNEGDFDAHQRMLRSAIREQVRRRSVLPESTDADGN